MTLSSNNNQLINRDMAFDMLTSAFPDLKQEWVKYLKEEYQNYDEERLDYIDLGLIIRYIVEKKKNGETKGFDAFFICVEDILIFGDHYTQELAIIGLLEGIQNVCGYDVDYYIGFNEWLKPKTKRAWLDLIEFWEGNNPQIIK